MAVSVSSYEIQRQKNILENRKVLQSLGLLNGGLLPKRQQVVDCSKSSGRYRKQGVKRKRSGSFHGSRPAPEEYNPGFNSHARRWSRRLEGKEPNDYGSLDFELEEEDEELPPIKSRRARISENDFGSIPGIPVGTTWAFRLDCSRDGVHRPTIAGIHGNESEGCYSIALSGGYEDDLDFGLAFTYTGAGGRDLKGTKANPKNLRTAPQSTDQTLTRSNLALSRNVENRQPVRVIRGYKLDSPYAPEEGYRYDGLYTVERFWEATGLSGHMVYKFALKRCDGQTPYPWKLNIADLINSDDENGTLPEDELVLSELEAKKEKMEKSGAKETDKHAIKLSPPEEKASSIESNAELARMKFTAKEEMNEVPEAKNAQELTAVSAENGEQQITKIPDSYSTQYQDSDEVNNSQIKDVPQALTLSAQNGVTPEISENGVHANQEQDVPSTLSTQNGVTPEISENGVHANQEQDVPSTLSTQNGVTPEISENGVQANQELVVKKQGAADVKEQKGTGLSPREINANSVKE